MTASSVDTAQLPLVRAADSAGSGTAVAPVPVRSVPVPIVRWDEADSSGVAPLAVSTQTPALEVDLEPFHTPVVACPTTVVVPGRLELRASRQLARRQRRLWAGAALAGMAVTLGATIVVLDVVH